MFCVFITMSREEEWVHRNLFPIQFDKVSNEAVEPGPSETWGLSLGFVFTLLLAQFESRIILLTWQQLYLNKKSESRPAEGGV